jgi:hypothetical protein
VSIEWEVDSLPFVVLLHEENADDEYETDVACVVGDFDDEDEANRWIEANPLAGNVHRRIHRLIGPGQFKRR